MKVVQEISVKLQNRPGTLSEVSELLSADGITIMAMTATTDGDQGIVRFVATDPKTGSQHIGSCRVRADSLGNHCGRKRRATRAASIRC